MGLKCPTEGLHFVTDLLFGLLKQKLRGRRHHNYEKVEVDIREYLRMYG